MLIKKILYITTSLNGTWRYFSWCYYPNIYYAKIQRKIIDRCYSYSKENLFIKFYPNDLFYNPNKEYSEKLNIKIFHKSLVDIISNENFDLIITEACATTLLEILCTKSQILLFCPKNFVKIYPKSMELLRKRAFVAETEEEYFLCLEKLLQLSQTIYKDLNDEFLLLYGICPMKNRGDSLKKSLQAIIKEYSKDTPILNEVVEKQ